MRYRSPLTIHRSQTSDAGFTLIELLLYIGVSAIILTGVSFFIVHMVTVREKQKTIAEVEQQGAQALALMTQAIRGAEAVNAPIAGSSGVSLNLDVVTGADDPTVFDLLGGVLRITQGAGSAIPLTSSAVAVSGLAIENLTRPGTPGSVKVEFTLSHVNPSGRNEFEYSRTFRGSASLRQ